MSENSQNPIDPDKVTENPHSIAFPHHVGSALIKPEDQGKLKGKALSAMEHQTDMQLQLLYDQMQLLAEQAKNIQDRKTISTFIYKAEMRFDPLINHNYHLYEKDNNYILSLISPAEWGKSRNNMIWIASVKLLADHTWEILKKNDAFEI